MKNIVKVAIVATLFGFGAAYADEPAAATTDTKAPEVKTGTAAPKSTTHKKTAKKTTPTTTTTTTTEPAKQ